MENQTEKIVQSEPPCSIQINPLLHSNPPLWIRVFCICLLHADGCYCKNGCTHRVIFLNRFPTCIFFGIKNMKKAFLTPEIMIIPLNAEDVIVTSQGNDAVDNWMSDNFDLT